jgi:hypothetical protein
VEEYSNQNARIIAKNMCLMNMGVVQEIKQQGHHFTQTYSLAKGLKHFREVGHQAANGEMK